MRSCRAIKIKNCYLKVYIKLMEWVTLTTTLKVVQKRCVMFTKASDACVLTEILMQRIMWSHCWRNIPLIANLYLEDAAKILHSVKFKDVRSTFPSNELETTLRSNNVGLHAALSRIDINDRPTLPLLQLIFKNSSETFKEITKLFNIIIITPITTGRERCFF